MDLALNNLQRLICHKTQQTNKINRQNGTTDVKLSKCVEQQADNLEEN